MASTNGSKAITGLIGLVLILTGALITSITLASNHVSRMDAQAMVDRGDIAIERRLERIEMKLDDLDHLIRQGQSP